MWNNDYDLIWGINPGSFLEWLRKTTEASVSMTSLGSENEYIMYYVNIKTKEFFSNDLRPLNIK
jgi:hypothetical protein